MKFIILITVSLWAALAHCGPIFNSEDIQTFEEFKQFFGKSYASSKEEALHKANFEHSLKYIRDNQGKNGLQLGINEFSDISNEEFFARSNVNSALNQTKLLESIPLAEESEFYESLPAHWDWREHIQWNPIENQGHCGSCWAFATVQTVEAQYAIRHRQLVHLSKQELVDCAKNTYDHHYINQGCKLGYVTEALKYMKEHGLYEEKYYPYNMADTHGCQLPRMASHQRFKINDYRRLIHGASDSSLMSVLKNNGPLSVNIYDHADAFKHYKSGVIRELPNHAQTTHSVVLVGWGSENGLDYWVIRNSWGANWGDHGYAKIGRGHNYIGINNVVVYPILH